MKAAIVGNERQSYYGKVRQAFDVSLLIVLCYNENAKESLSLTEKQASKLGVPYVWIKMENEQEVEQALAEVKKDYGIEAFVVSANASPIKNYLHNQLLYLYKQFDYKSSNLAGNISRLKTRLVKGKGRITI